MSRRVIVLLIGINLLWGGASFAVKIALDHGMLPISLAFFRFSFSALFLYGVSLRAKIDLRVACRDWGRFWMLGILGLSLTYLLSYEGLALTTATDSSLLTATEPVFLALLACVFLRERAWPAKIAGILLGLVGVYLIITGGWLPAAINSAMPYKLLGDVLIGVSLLFEAMSSILGKRLVRRYPALTVMTYQMTCGALVLAPFAMQELMRSPQMPPISVPVLLCLLYLIFPCTVLAYTVWFALLDKNNAGEMSVYLFIQPVVGALLGIAFLQDKVSFFTLLGSLLVLLGIALLHSRRSARSLAVDPISH